MAYEVKDQSGSLWKNDHKESDTHADYAGTVKIDGKEMWINAWVKTAKNGKKYFSLSFRPKTAAKSNMEKAQERAAAAPAPDDDIPF